MHPELQRLRTLPVTEKLRVVEELWDDICQSEERFPLPAWHRREVQRRADELDADPSIALSREELRHRIDSNNG